MTRKRVLTEDEWRDIGRKTLELEEGLLDLTRALSGAVPVAVVGRILRLRDNLFSVRGKLEDEMFKRGGPQYIHVFYRKPSR